ncbi:TPA: hypothetical protein GXZ34_02645 [bacterium]|nr:hypothetical protein [bacterium]
MSKKRGLMYLFAFLTLVITGCKEVVPSSDCELISVNGFEGAIINRHNIVEIIVDNNKTTLDFNNLFIVSEKATYKVFDKDQSREIEEAHLDLANNEFKLKVTAEDEVSFKLYTINVYRTKEFEVNYENEEGVYEIVDLNHGPAPVTITENKDYNFTLAKLDDSYNFSVSVNEVPLEPNTNGVYQIKNVIVDLNIKVSKVKKTYKITLPTREGFMIIDNNGGNINSYELTFEYGSRFDFRIELLNIDNYEKADKDKPYFKVLINEIELDSYNDYDFYVLEDIRENYNLKIDTSNIVLKSYEVNYENEEGIYELVDLLGDPAPKTININEDYSFKINQLDEKYDIEVKVDGVIYLPEDGVYTVKGVKSDLNIEVNASIKTFTLGFPEVEERIAYDIIVDGTHMSDPEIEVEYGSNLSITLQLKEGYEKVDEEEPLFKVFIGDVRLGIYNCEENACSINLEFIIRDYDFTIDTDNIREKELG